MAPGFVDLAHDGTLKVLSELDGDALLAAIATSIDRVEEECCSRIDDAFAGDSVDVGEEVAQWQLRGLRRIGDQVIASVDAEVMLVWPGKGDDLVSFGAVPVTLV